MNTVEKKYPEGTTREQWEKYEIDKARHEAYCKEKMPKAEYFTIYSGPDSGYYDEVAYNAAMREWEMMKSMDAPNMPGYFRANND